MLMRAGLTLRNFQCTPIKTENSLGGYAYFCEWDLMAPINTDRASALDYGNDGWFIGVLGTIRG
ncbi:hypothetical protein JCM17844_14420 [Iodidimonas gelatinilytica]|uniref:Uncharacterized protein n=3 Tax=Iodidimonas gelatinilytica TaxID=1236966 RepID=A0A5A7N0M7_9PROT|nr:hypothetical protein JCM17844_14420 [Iodidimonas gelatinilytica]GER01245.1 hypothetical protein JCM17845_18680 [Iodidimonas gelatinilytica]